MTRNRDLDAALAEICLQWNERTPTENERRVIERLGSHEAVASAWRCLTTEQPNHQGILRAVLTSFQLVEKDMLPRTLSETDKEFKNVAAAFDTITEYYGRRSGVVPSSIKANDAKFADYNADNIRQLRIMQATNLLIWEFEIGDAVQFPIVEQTGAASNRALNFAYCLTFYLQALHKRPFLEFVMSITAILYEGAKFAERSLQAVYSRREAETQRLMSEYHADKHLSRINRMEEPFDADSIPTA